jgi:hypothetical protein
MTSTDGRPAAAFPGGADELPTALAPWQRMLNEDYLVTHGRDLGLALPRVLPRDQVDAARANLGRWARSVGVRGIIESCLVSDEEFIAQRQKIDDLRDQIPLREEAVQRAKEELEAVRSENVLVGTQAPRRPPMWLFLVVGTTLGIVFGLIGATTISAVLRSVWRVDVDDPATFYMKWGTALAVFIGLVIGTVTILTREFAAGAGRFVRWGPGVMGALFAIGLSGYRVLETADDGSAKLVWSPLAIVLLFLELGILVAIEVVNHVALNAWENYHTANRGYQLGVEKEKAASSKLQDRQTLLTEAKTRFTREDGVHRDMAQKRHFYEVAQNNRAELEDWAERAALRGFEMAFRERQLA